MNFLVTFNSPTQQQTIEVINASSWATCLAYCEGKGLDIFQIQQLPNAVIFDNVSGSTNCFQVVAKNSSNVLVNNYVWETDFDSLTTWIDLQGFQSIQSILLSNKSYVVV